MSIEVPPPSDQMHGVPHPREASDIFGQSAAEAEFLEAFNSRRLHHGWLLCGPKGIGKSTLAWRIARFLLATPIAEHNSVFPDAETKCDSLFVPSDHPVATRISARSEPALFSIIRTYNEKTGRLRDQIVVDDVRQLSHFLTMSVADGGRRVVIVDSVDDMNTNAANALLKMLEEPPARTTLLLITHQPARLLPTIRSRVRELRLMPLSSDNMHHAFSQTGLEITETPALAELAGGSVGEAIQIANGDGVQMYALLLSIFSNEHGYDRQRALKLAESVGGRGAENRLTLLFNLINLFMSRVARTGAIGHPPAVAITPEEASILRRLAPNKNKSQQWASAAQEILERTSHGRAVNLDPVALVLDTVFKLHQISST